MKLEPQSLAAFNLQTMRRHRVFREKREALSLFIVHFSELEQVY